MNELVWDGLVFIKLHYSSNWILISTVTVLKKRQCWEYLLSCVPCVFMPLYPFYGGKKLDVFFSLHFLSGFKQTVRFSRNHIKIRGDLYPLSPMLTVRPAAVGTSLLWEKLRWGGKDLGPLLSTRLAAVTAVVEGGVAALGRPREGEGVALGNPRDGEGKPGSDTAEGKVGKLLRWSLFTGRRKRKIYNKHVNYVAKHIRGVFNRVHKIGQGNNQTTWKQNSHISQLTS